MIKDNHPYQRVQALNQLITWEGANSFDRTMQRANAPATLELVSIDVDGNDWHIWRAIDAYRPRVVVIEINPTIPTDVYFVQDADPAINWGSSLLATIHLGQEKGYSLVCCNGLDAFFVLDELYRLFGIEDNCIDSMWPDWRVQTSLFSGYDGTLFSAGYKRLHWQGIDFRYDQLQVLSKEQRVWCDNPGA